MNTSEMLNLLALRLEDAAKIKFTDSFKLKALNNSQIKLAQMLFNPYLTELQVVDGNTTVTSGVVNIYDLDYKVLRGAEGIQKVVVYGGLDCTEIDIADAKKMENTYLEGTTKNPLYYVFENKIYVYPTTITAVDIYYLKMPAPLLFPFVIDDQVTTPSTTSFQGWADQELSTIDGAYNGCVIYSLRATAGTVHLSYHVVTDYDATGNAEGELLFTVSPAATRNFVEGDTIYLLTDPHDQINLDAVTCGLNPSLHELVVTLAEAECWTMDQDLKRRKVALDAAFIEVEILNTRYQKAQGIGTAGDRRFMTAQ